MLSGKQIQSIQQVTPMNIFVTYTHSIFLYQCQYPVDTGRKLNVHKMFRRRPGRLLSVSCKLNLRPVSTG